MSLVFSSSNMVSACNTCNSLNIWDSFFSSWFFGSQGYRGKSIGKREYKYDRYSNNYSLQQPLIIVKYQQQNLLQYVEEDLCYFTSALSPSSSCSTAAVSKLYNLPWLFALQQIIASPHLKKILHFMSCTVWKKSVELMKLSLLSAFSYTSKYCPQSGQNIIQLVF